MEWGWTKINFCNCLFSVGKLWFTIFLINIFFLPLRIHGMKYSKGTWTTLNSAQSELSWPLIIMLLLVQHPWETRANPFHIIFWLVEDSLEGEDLGARNAEKLRYLFWQNIRSLWIYAIALIKPFSFSTYNSIYLCSTMW